MDRAARRDQFRRLGHVVARLNPAVGISVIQHLASKRRKSGAYAVPQAGSEEYRGTCWNSDFENGLRGWTRIRKRPVVQLVTAGKNAQLTSFGKGDVA